MLAGIFTFCLLCFIIAYRFYGAFLARRFELDNRNKVPSETMYDGVDYVPAKAPLLLGHHFSSIAGAGPIVGPIIAGLAFGWLPAILWVLIGSIFIGGVHDFGSLVASIRHKARSVAELVNIHMSRTGYVLFLVFIWLALIYVLIVFLDLTSGTFTADGGVASSSVLFILLAIALGLVLYRGGAPLGRTTLVFLPLLAAALWAGPRVPLSPPPIAGEVKRFWDVTLLVYCLLASIVPVWALLQPRDFLSSFLLYASIAGAFAGIMLGGVPVQYPAITSLHAKIGPLFPILFITVACGACSGFHSIIASGTSSKQLRCERDATPIGYGSMLIEGVLAVIALATVMVLTPGSSLTGVHPTLVFATGMGRFLSVLGLPAEAGRHFGLLAVSTFLLTTLDTCTRLSRYIFQEIFGLSGKRGRITGTVASLAFPAIFAFITLTDTQGNAIPAWRAIWPVFGATNQLLAGLALLVITIWLRQKGRSILFAFLPMVFMIAMTLWALVILVISGGTTGIVRLIAAVLFVLALILVVQAALAFRRPPPRHDQVEPKRLNDEPVSLC